MHCKEKLMVTVGFGCYLKDKSYEVIIYELEIEIFLYFNIILSFLCEIIPKIVEKCFNSIYYIILSDVKLTRFFFPSKNFSSPRIIRIRTDIIVKLEHQHSTR